jgi:hypothetical protein
MLHCLIADFDLVDRPAHCAQPERSAASNDELAEAIARGIIEQIG